MATRATLSSSIETAIVSATVATTFSFILNVLFSLLREEYGLLSGFQDELEKLESIFTRIQSVLYDAMTRQLKDRALQDWLVKLTDVACHAEDVLDKFNFEVTRRNSASSQRCLREVRDFFSGNNQLIFRCEMAHEIKELRGKMDSFAEEVSKFNLGQGGSERLIRDQNERMTHSFVESSDVVGRDEEKKKVVAMLLNNGATSTNLSVIAIVGVGGIGKTTLVKLVYNDTGKGGQLAYNDRGSIHAYFDLKIWVCVSDDFDLSRILKSLIGSATKKKCELDDLDQLQIKTREVLQGKKFLLVLDDVWNEEQQKWDDLETLLRSGARGSKVVVTTRSRKVSSIVNAFQNILLSPLPDNLCWELFQRRAFDSGTTPNENFVAIGKEIVKKCGGNPLAAQSLGSLLRFKDELSDWKWVLDNEMWQLFDSQNGEIMPVLRLSYDHLSPRAKQCFLFCCLFPKDYELEKKTLIQQWMSNGFVLNEKSGREVFNDLWSRCFFVEVKKNEDGLVIECKLHDLMHDLARSVAGKQFCTIMKDIKGDAIYKRTYHLLIDQWSSHLTMLEETKKAKSLRTLLISRCYPIEESFLSKFFVILRCLRVIDFSSSGIKIMPESVGSLIHLRYLNLSNNPIEVLPVSIRYLLNLQVLELSKTKLKKLPKCLGKLQSLRHLGIRGCQLLTDMPIGVGRLTHLQTLTDFIVNKKKTSCELEELKELNLSGELFIWHLENFNIEATEIEQMILSSKENLVSLRLTWDHHNNATSNNDNERVLDMLRPHLNLKRLQLHNYSGHKFPPWISDSLITNLVEIKLAYCTNCKHLPSFGNIASLKDLQIIGMHEVTQINGAFYGTGPIKGFPALEKLAFFNMPKLEEWSAEEMSFPQLIMLTIGMCGALRSIPWVKSIQKLDLSDCSSSLVASLANKTNLPVLSSLMINNIQGLTSLPDRSLLGLNSLKKLLVSSCKQLQCLPLKDMEQLVALQSLEIADCPELNSLALLNASQLTCLQNLNIRNCEKLNSLPQNWSSLASVRSMTVVGCRNVTSWTELEIRGLSSMSDFSIEICNDKVNLSSCLQHLTNLETIIVHGGEDKLHPQPSKWIMGNYLIICCCSDLGSLLDGLSNATSLKDLQLKNISSASLPDSIGEIQSLQNLSIDDCANLTSLPNSLRGLSRLEGLSIHGCPDLERRCQRDTGEDWSIISHIRTVGIGAGNLT
ncbi:CC-NBS-LRR disease resistance protein [Rhynchospora pubera]|uniref:CC-NBS-LRR disease resistance protein n=1 Tax=Rhynchospora pubera TaxID=906938 RepID=A0AAV8GAZ8_9POAL|nr:CC-NBS-LRR disease resistance protein [Rhynchospora pubera]